MFRLGVTKHLRSAVIQQSLISAPIMGPRLRPIPAVKVDVDGPIRNIAIRKAGSTESVALRHVVDQLIAIAGATRASAIGAPSIGYDARLVVVKSGIDTRVLINPVITSVSQATSTAWDADGEMVYRVMRPRSVTVKYTTVEGDEEEWYDLATSESLWLQRVLDGFDGASSVERLAPCVATEPGLYPKAVSNGLVGAVSRTLFEAYQGYLSGLTDIKAADLSGECLEATPMD